MKKKHKHEKVSVVEIHFVFYKCMCDDCIKKHKDAYISEKEIHKIVTGVNGVGEDLGMLPGGVIMRKRDREYEKEFAKEKKKCQ